MKNTRTQIVKIGPLGSLTLCVPEMEGRYMLIEQGEAQITLRPVELELHGSSREAVAAQDAQGQLVLLASYGNRTAARLKNLN